MKLGYRSARGSNRLAARLDGSDKDPWKDVVNTGNLALKKDHLDESKTTPVSSENLCLHIGEPLINNHPSFNTFQV